LDELSPYVCWCVSIWFVSLQSSVGDLYLGSMPVQQPTMSVSFCSILSAILYSNSLFCSISAYNLTLTNVKFLVHVVVLLKPWMLFISGIFMSLSFNSTDQLSWIKLIAINGALFNRSTEKSCMCVCLIGMMNVCSTVPKMRLIINGRGWLLSRSAIEGTLIAADWSLCRNVDLQRARRLFINIDHVGYLICPVFRHSLLKWHRYGTDRIIVYKHANTVSRHFSCGVYIDPYPYIFCLLLSCQVCD